MAAVFAAEVSPRSSLPFPEAKAAAVFPLFSHAVSRRIAHLDPILSGSVKLKALH